MGRVNVVLLLAASCSREMMSEMAGTSSRAATRGKRDFAAEEVAETTCVKGEDPDKSFSNKGESISGTASVYCGEVECRTEESPFNLELQYLEVKL
jgi:hypothetical protein